MCFTLCHGKRLGETLKLPRLLRVSGASRSRPASRLGQNFERLGLVSVSAQKVSCPSVSGAQFSLFDHPRKLSIHHCTTEHGAKLLYLPIRCWCRCLRRQFNGWRLSELLNTRHLRCIAIHTAAAATAATAAVAAVGKYLDPFDHAKHSLRTGNRANIRRTQFLKHNKFFRTNSPTFQGKSFTDAIVHYCR